jgi:glycolate oxidase
VSDFQTLHEIVKAARANLPDGPWDYLVGGSESETTLRRNRLGLDALAFRPRVLRDVSKVDCTSTVLGAKVRMPVSLAPMGALESLEAGAAMSVAKAAEQFGVVSFLSSVTLPGLEEIAAGTKHPKVYQLYVRGDRAWVEDYVRRAIEHRYQAFCFTVDTALYSRRERDLIKRYTPAARRRAGGMDYQAAMTWDTVKWFKDTFGMPLVLKGIATAEDAALCVEHGVECVYVSNHGGRQLDHGQGSIEVLPDIVEAVRGRAEIVVDGGFLRGTDVLKALALGANSVAIGKLQGFGLAAAGAAGIVRVLEILETEIKTSMGLLGVATLADLDRSFVHPAPPVHAPGVVSAFPLLDLKQPEY